MIGKYDVEDAEKLIKLARESIKAKFTGEKVKLPEEKQFMQARGVFVTLTKKGDLRGCIGIPEARMPVNKAVAYSARAAAFEDPRFPAVKENELDEIKIEISILTQPVLCKASEVKKGDGLMCEYVGYGGLLLPQVAITHNMSKLEFIEALCSKAGLPRDTWQKEGFKLFKFNAQVFSEKENGEIVEEKFN